MTKKTYESLCNLIAAMHVVTETEVKTDDSVKVHRRRDGDRKVGVTIIERVDTNISREDLEVIYKFACEFIRDCENKENINFFDEDVWF